MSRFPFEWSSSPRPNYTCALVRNERRHKEAFRARSRGLEAREVALTLRTRAMVLDSLCSTFPNNPASELLSWLTVEFLVVLQSDDAAIGASFPLAPCDGALGSTGV